MKKKITVFIAFLLLIIILIICSVSTEVENNVDNQAEIQPEEEITEEVLRQTKVNLYFVDNTSGILAKEERIIDSKELIDLPYKYILDLLLAGPEKEGLVTAIPENTKLNSVTFEKGIVTVDLSEEFLNSDGTNSIYSIVDTLTEFTEVNGVKFTINGEVKENLKEVYVKV